MEIRIVWPAFLSIAGAVMLIFYAIAALVFFRLAEPVLGPPVSFAIFLPYVGVGSSGLVGLGFSLALLLDGARHRFWGILVLAAYGLAFYFLVTFLESFLLNWLVLFGAGFYVLASALFLGAAGAILGILWNPPEARTESRASSDTNLKD